MKRNYFAYGKRSCRVGLFLFCLSLMPLASKAQVDYSVVQVKEESGANFTQITKDNDYVAMPEVKRNSRGVKWFTNRILDISPDGNNIAYLSLRSNSTNIFIKDINKQGASTQRTNKQSVIDFSFSPNGEYICFTASDGSKMNQIFQTSANSGYVCRQITNGNLDYSPTYSTDMKSIFFTRMERNGASVWGYNIANNFLSSYTSGMNPCPDTKPDCLLCTRFNAEGRGEIWRVNYASGVEECIVSDPQRSFSSPCLSPDGKWIVMVGSNKLVNDLEAYYNTDIFACHADGTQLVQLTYHAADDLSPVWSRDGKYIYFISQRGSATATANVWRMDFVY
jgi:Tol biopolymer transport system component